MSLGLLGVDAVVLCAFFAPVLWLMWVAVVLIYSSGKRCFWGGATCRVFAVSPCNLLSILASILILPNFCATLLQ